ncbi:MAG: NUDIX domain-containing protein [Proteobacteria bacterium]|nr:NUDIX domain-containing protein [Pseudomonadota bacterium]
MELSAALLVWRRRDGRPEFLLAHPGGPIWRNRDAGAWSIPKGLVEPGEDMRAAALREFAEETGIAPPTGLTPLAPCLIRRGKTVAAWLGRADLDLSAARYGLFEMEWPPRSGQRARFPEVDRLAYFRLEEALAKLSPGQHPILREAAGRLGA